MSTPRTPRPSFQAIDLDPIDRRLDAKAAAKGIPTLVTPPPPKAVAAPPAVTPPPSDARLRSDGQGQGSRGTPRNRMKAVNIELPDYVWIELKTRAARDMVSVRHVIMTALKAQGLAIADADMVEDGRRLRGAAATGA